ncbi:DNA polymerase III subunit delta [[Clostridium] polysaccharolyticum]|uniref:DNA polymerase III subunit delta n=1 Tax=[Clostridium] polysaccharolyticum TaxID=29364 RepID=A0A1I0EJ50_9FIRM|nr:DNA polymerase III subunit delta [[Clostridium] polysaccharolyticum]SET45445.1 DNA polymerase III, delta subunit [[Clostridium] polysaccharolyticum]
MQIIKEHIKLKQFKQCYLLYGTEEYLKKLYKNKLKTGIIGDEDTMNYTYFEGKSIEIPKVIEVAETMPFFSERRLILIQNSGLFQSANDLADYIKTMPDYCYIIFVESEVDKRNRLYKAVKDIGVIAKMDGLDEKNVQLWVAQLLNRSGKKITKDTLMYFLNKSGTDMEGMVQEVEKLVCYAMDKEVITAEDIDAVCVTQVSNQIFLMIDAIASGKQKQALGLYYDLLALREKPMSILFLITRHFNILLQVKELQGQNRNDVAKKAGVPPFAVHKYMSQADRFTKQGLIASLKNCAEMEAQVKTGLMADQMAVELLIVKFSQR